MGTAVLQVLLLLFAMAGFGGAGASLAVVRARHAAYGEHDAGMIVVAAMLFLFGAVSSGVEWGVMGMAAIGIIAGWVGYVTAAQRLGLFQIVTGRLIEERAHEPRQRT